MGIDRDDVVNAYGDASERAIDLSDVNGRVFVNNVSLGIYTEIIGSPEYRDAKVGTTLAALPKVLGPGSRPYDLQFEGPTGERHAGAHLVMISNNPYGTDNLEALTSRPRLDTKRLGIISLELADDRAASRFLTAIGTRHPERFDGFASWTATTFEVRSGSRIDVGLDGESMSMEAPLRFSIREQSLRVRLSDRAVGYSPAARTLSWRAAARGVWRVARGRPVGMESE